MEALFKLDRIVKEKMTRMMRSGRIIFYCVISFFVVIGFTILALWINNMYQSKHWLVKPALPGRLIPVNGSNIYARLVGRGGTTVVILPEIAHPSFLWWDIQDELAKSTQVLTYDRGGIWME
jgi:hypothetical protein